MTDQKETVNVSEEEQWEKLLETERFHAPLVDLYETADDFILTASMPGVKKDDVKLKIKEGVLSIFGKVNGFDMTGKRYLIKETGSGNYFRRFNLSNSIDEAKIGASFENGQLNIRLPKHERVKPRTININ